MNDPAYATFALTLQPQSAFGSQLKGDTLFGQLCWAIRHECGGEVLSQLLADYTNSQPFAVVSDAFPKGFLPKPTLPDRFFDAVPSENRKEARKKIWFPLDDLSKLPLNQWLQTNVTDSVAYGCHQDEEEQDKQRPCLSRTPQMHNQINRQTGTTGADGFAPYTTSQTWYPAETELTVYVVLDENQCSAEYLIDLFSQIGSFGFGRDASIGLGKFDVTDMQPFTFPTIENANAAWALAPVAPQGLGFNADRSFYEPFTRFGKHGDLGAISGRPFKTPLLLAQTGAVFTPKSANTLETALKNGFIGQGLGGKNSDGEGVLSNAISETVHQGYAPIVPMNLEAQEESRETS